MEPVENQYGEEFPDLEDVEDEMDSEVYAEVAKTVDPHKNHVASQAFSQEFYNEYCKAHLAKFGEEFIFDRESYDAEN